MSDVHEVSSRGIKRCRSHSPAAAKLKCTGINSDGSGGTTASTHSIASTNASWTSSGSEEPRVTPSDSTRVEVCSVDVPGNDIFVVPSQWRLLQLLGRGAFSTVVAFLDPTRRERVAVKGIGANVLEQAGAALGVARELQILRKCKGHENVVEMLDAYCVAGRPEIYIVMEYIPQTLQDVIYSWFMHTEQFCRFHMVKILMGLQFLHAKCVSHCDLKPSNILVDGKKVKICDFNSSRYQTFCPRKTTDFYELTDCVGTRFWRAPEILLLTSCDTRVDMWSAGCIFAEILECRILFRGKNDFDQLRMILRTLGATSSEEIETDMLQPGAESFLAENWQEHGRNLADNLTSHRSSQTLATLSSMLQFDRRKRASAEECLQQECFAAFSNNLQDINEEEGSILTSDRAQLVFNTETSPAEQLRQTLPCYSFPARGGDCRL
eukprot:TRINITY_DN2298_c0_g1_i1.p1 TRINITY_DN2298_c0_g1~~TRINITY_DN2298_c0_g1_i1.p1  ORF type:complete len:437 (+),score=68.18 TRINITY_DN2298_c0_g1_i1:74-1384(+)